MSCIKFWQKHKFAPPMSLWRDVSSWSGDEGASGTLESAPFLLRPMVCRQWRSPSILHPRSAVKADKTAMTRMATEGDIGCVPRDEEELTSPAAE
jgi:hypothetical protein